MQKIQGQVRSAEPVYGELDQWIKEISRGADGWLGSTAGVTEDNRFIGLGRWESEEAARRNSARPEQDRWWNSFAELFTEPPQVQNSTNIFISVPSEPEQARFVQVVLGRGSDTVRARELIGSHGDTWAGFRPEILGTVGCMDDDGTYAIAVYFSSEEAAREGERKEPPPKLQVEIDEIRSLSIGAPEYFDLRQPWVHSR